MLCVVLLCVECALIGCYVTWLPGARLQCWMLLPLYTLPQLAVSAKILCLLMVVICGAVPSMVRSVRLYSRCAHLYVNALPNGTVMARSDGNDQPNLTISTRGVSLDLLIYSPIQGMYLCFRRNNLVGRRISKAQAENSPNCLFREEFINGYNQYHLATNPNRFIGFNRKGMPMRKPKSRTPEDMQRCFSFMKYDYDFDINRHNTVRAGDTTWQRPQRRLRASASKSLKSGCRGVRHHHAKTLKRKICDGT